MYTVHTYKYLVPLCMICERLPTTSSAGRGVKGGVTAGTTGQVLRPSNDLFGSIDHMMCCRGGRGVSVVDDRVRIVR